MANDVPDWTGQQRVNIRGEVSGSPLGDTGAPTLDRDSATEQLSLSGGGVVQAVVAVLASFKPAVGAVIALVKAGAWSETTNLVNYTPPPGQATTAGNFLLAYIKAITTDPSCVTAGWAKVVSRQSAVSGEWVAIWARPNCGAAEAGPTFTNPGGSFFRGCSMAEFSGVLAVAPNDRNASAVGVASPVTVTMPGADASFGDLVALATGWQNLPNGSASYSDTFNNGASSGQLGGSAGLNRGQHSNFSFGIVPAATTVLPLGTAPWDYDVIGTSAPAAGTAASVVLAATTGKRYRATSLDASIISTAAAATAPAVQLKDGAAVIWSQYLGLVATAEAENHIEKTGAAIPGSSGNSMTLAFTANVANIAQTANLGAYLR